MGGKIEDDSAQQGSPTTQPALNSTGDVQVDVASPLVIQLPEGITKRIIQAGEGEEKPDNGHEVCVHYRGTFEDGKEFDSSHSRNEPFSFTLGTGSVIKGWEIAVKTMQRSEIAEFGIPPELAYGENGSPPTIPPNARLIFIIELIDWEIDDTAGDDLIYSLSIAQRLEKCLEKKQTGGKYFKEAKYDLAIRQYRDIMKLAQISEFRDDGKVVELDSCANSQIPPESEEERAKRLELKQMLLVGHLNLALCYLRVNKQKECLQNCNNALELDPSNVKALFRKGMAYMSTNDYELALAQFEKVLEFDPANTDAKQQKSACNLAIKNYYQKQKDIYKNLFAPKKA